MITAEYLLGCLYHQADWASGNQYDSAEWKLCPQVFQKICQKVGKPDLLLGCPITFLLITHGSQTQTVWP